MNEYEHIIEDEDDKMIVDESSIGSKSTLDYDSDWNKTPRTQEVPSTYRSAF